MSFPITVRYILRPEREKLWTVFDTTTGKPAEFRGIILKGLDRDVASFMLNALIGELPPEYTGSNGP
jgi:hypothetical protein